ncbi:hypothetical protein ABEB36_012718 [Hypothenemus hampei]|uniref:Uncharacterized protein n=1 Tax=Hypothenemus hampei TaxID=57062 RepID=A0ABD1EGH3_HYPHA
MRAKQKFVGGVTILLLRRREAIFNLFFCPNCPLDPKGPSGGIFWQEKRDKHGRYRARQCIQFKRDAR